MPKLELHVHTLASGLLVCMLLGVNERCMQAGRMTHDQKAPSRTRRGQACYMPTTNSSMHTYAHSFTLITVTHEKMIK